ncbi:MAG: class B sortase [Acutalibacteraceae bacterium]|nr:class B sortase [Acutalibacteraceae bacterium]
MKSKSKSIWKAVFVIAIILMIAALGYACWYLINLYTSGDEYSGVLSYVSTEPTEAYTTVYVDSADAPLDNVAPPEVYDTINGGINFTKLWEINTDLYAWIQIPDTMINYPIAQYPGDDNTYYLNHNMFKESAFAGCIYTEKANSKDFDDRNTVLYGHNMLNGSMFRALHDFRNKDFFDKNQYIYVYLPDRTLKYHIFSAYEYDDRHILDAFNFKDNEVYQKYLKYAQNPTSTVHRNTRDLKLNVNDKIITLSTCFGDVTTSRYLVQGVLISEEFAEQ